MTTTVLNTKIGEVENEIPDTRGLVTITVFNTKIWEVENKFSDHTEYSVTPTYNKFSGSAYNKKLKQANLAIKALTNLATK